MKDSSIESFLASPALALAGASHTGKKFGNMVYAELVKNGYCVHLLHPTGETIEGKSCFRTLADLPEAVGGVVCSVPEAQAEAIIREAAAAHIPAVWLLSGPASPKTTALCAELGITCISGTCIIMYLRNTAWFHRVHKWAHDKFGAA